MQRVILFVCDRLPSLPKAKINADDAYTIVYIVLLPVYTYRHNLNVPLFCYHDYEHAIENTKLFLSS